MRKAHPSFYDQDFRRIDVRHSGDIGYWAVMLNCRVSELKDAVLAAGPVVCDVDNYLRRRAQLAVRS
jgi:hypothetical protein